MRYRPELDGLRALAVLAVLAAHTGTAIALGGWLGVDIFFVLSGFLITGLLLKEFATQGSVSLKSFYARRALRLYPALGLLLVLGLPFYRFLGSRSTGEVDATMSGYALTALVVGTYTMDLVFGLTGNPVGELSHTWSLAVEEQFYLLWPLTLILLLRRGRDVFRWAALIALASLLMMLALIGPSASGAPDYAYYLPVSRFWELMVGCCLAVVVERGRIPTILARPWVGPAAASLAVAALLGAAWWGSRLPYPRAGGGSALAWAAPAMAIAAAAVLLHTTALPGGLVVRVLSTRVLVWLGRRSYGIYLYHYPVLVVLERTWPQRRMVVAATMLVITVAVAELSYRFIERRFLRLKASFSPGAAHRSRRPQQLLDPGGG